MSADLTVADVFRDGHAMFLAEYGSRLTSEQRRVLRDVEACRTAAFSR